MVTVEDVTEADRPASTVSVERREVDATPAGGTIPFRTGAELREGREYAVRAHLDVAGTGVIEPGDFASVQRYRVVGEGGAPHRLELHPIPHRS